MSSPQTHWLLAVLMSCLPVLASAADLDQPPIEYSRAPANNSVTGLEAKLQAKSVRLTADAEFGYLKSLLKELTISPTSQVLVFSKTSLQRNRIEPKTPRAIYFSDDVTVGYCQGGPVMEIAVTDPKLGTVFYTLDQSREPPTFKRQGETCLLCHGSSKNQGMPGHLVRSVSVDRRGELTLTRGSIPVDHTTPFAERWGGWYVTGTSGKQTHHGNAISGGWPWADKERPPSPYNVIDLKPYFDVTKYPTPHSDLVALMVLEHQSETQNRLTRANFLTRQALFDQAKANATTGTPKHVLDATHQMKIDDACEPVVQHLLFCGEAKLTSRVAGTSDFATEFAARGPFDAQQRSLRDFDLRTRLFKYPLSYLVYSKAFDSLPPEAKERIYQRLWDVLTSRDVTAPFAHLSKEDRQAVRAILLATKTTLPVYWRE